MGALRSSIKCLTRALRGDEASLKDLRRHFSVLANSNPAEFSRRIAGCSVPNFHLVESSCSGGRSLSVFDRRKDVEFKEHAEEKYLKALSYPRATLDIPWLPSSLGLKIQSASVDWAKRRGWRQHMSTAAVEASEPATTDGIVITDSCIRRIKEIQSEDGAAAPKMLRLSVEGGGCSGFLYNFSLDDKQNADDRLFEKDGVTVVVDDISLSFVKGSTIDFSEELIRASFTVAANPNASSGCGCGASFTAK